MVFSSSGLALVIPAYEPPSGLITQLHLLAESNQFAAIVVVDDGSSAAYAETFAEAARIPDVTVIQHARNRGKGAALKTGFDYAIQGVPGLTGVVTADADGQHFTADILRVADRLRDNPHTFVLGARAFEGDVPLRSRFGNQLTRLVVGLVAGQKLTDTQTGLRGIPAALLPRLLRLPSSGYDFELEMLLTAKQISCHIEETPIQTIYEPGNRSSHFKPRLDSLKIYFVLLRSYAVNYVVTATVVVVCLLALGAVAINGFSVSSVLSQVIWYPTGLDRVQRFVVIFGLIFLPVMILAGRFFKAYAVILLFVATVIAVGPLRAARGGLDSTVRDGDRPAIRFK